MENWPTAIVEWVDSGHHLHREPVGKCPVCGEAAKDEWVDIGFGPYFPARGAVSLPELSLDSRRVSTENLFEGAVFELELLSGCSLALRGGHDET